MTFIDFLQVGHYGLGGSWPFLRDTVLLVMLQSLFLPKAFVETSESIPYEFNDHRFREEPLGLLF